MYREKTDRKLPKGVVQPSEAELARAIPGVGLAVAAGSALFGGFTGARKAGENFGLQEGEKATVIKKDDVVLNGKNVVVVSKYYAYAFIFIFLLILGIFIKPYMVPSNNNNAVIYDTEKKRQQEEEERVKIEMETTRTENKKKVEEEKKRKIAASAPP